MNEELEKRDSATAESVDESTAPVESVSVPAVPPIDVRRERLQPASIAFGISFIVLFTSVCQFILSGVIASYAPQLMDRDWYLTVMSTAPMYAIAMPLSLFLFLIGKAEPPKPKKLSPLVWSGLLAICFALTCAGNVMGNIVNTVIGAITGEIPTNEIGELTANTPFWANLLFCGILAPILEEIFYRKLVIDRLRRYGDLFAVLASGLLFGLIHGNFSQFFYATFAGLLFGYIYLNTGRLRYTVALHMAVNLMGGVFSTELYKLLDLNTWDGNLIQLILEHQTAVLLFLGYLLFMLVCIIAAPIALALLWKYIRFRKPKTKLSRKDAARVFLLNPPVWLLCAVVILLFVL